jgi:antitoxin PrlF
MTGTVTTKGQVTIPKRFRDHLGIRPGSAVTFQLTEGGDVVVRRAATGGRRARGGKDGSPFARLRGRAPVPMSTDEILALTRGPLP